MTTFRPHEACRSLRCKGMYLPGEPVPPDVELEVTETAVFWCLKSQAVVGPDGGPVEPGDCRPGRSCHRARGVTLDRRG